MDFSEKIIEKNLIHSGAITQYELWQVELPDGQRAEREVVLHDDAAAVIAFNQDKRMIFVRQHRVAIGQNSLEIPAGLIDPTDDSPLEAAQRELEEETGLAAENWQKIAGFYHSPGFCDEYLYIFEAHDLKTVKDPRPQDDDEYLEVVALTFDEAQSYLKSGEICDSKTVYALLYWQFLLAKDVL